MTTNNPPSNPNATHQRTHPPVQYPAIQGPLWWGPVRQIDDVEEMENLTRQGWCLITTHACATMKKIEGQLYQVERIVYVLGRAQQ